MIIVVEGAMGTGKTTVATELSRYSSIPVYRAFRSATDGHDVGSDPRIKQLADVGLPVNSWQEDLFIADLLARTGSDVILDRSLPSGLHWNLLGAADAEAALDVWGERLAATGAVLVALSASEEVRRRRTPRFSAGESWNIERALQYVAKKYDIPFSTYFTDTEDPEAIKRLLVCVFETVSAERGRREKAKRPNKNWDECPYKGHADDCDCHGYGGDR